jgi:hypothetical protein
MATALLMARTLGVARHQHERGGQMVAGLTDQAAGPSGTPRPSRWAAAIHAVSVTFAIVAAGLVAELSRYGALAGGRVAREAVSHRQHSWPRMGWPHLVANAVSVLGGTVVAPVLLLALAAVLAVRLRRWVPLCRGAAAMVAVGLVVATGKWWAGSLAVSGPATSIVVVCAVACWLLRPLLPAQVRAALSWLAASVVLTVGVAQLYLGHSILALLASWLAGGATFGALALLARASSRRLDRVG